MQISYKTAKSAKNHALSPACLGPKNAYSGRMASSEWRVERGAAGRMIIPLPRRATARLVKPGGHVERYKMKTSNINIPQSGIKGTKTTPNLRIVFYKMRKKINGKRVRSQVPEPPRGRIVPNRLVIKSFCWDLAGAVTLEFSC
jgi:hypothetical protein